MMIDLMMFSFCFFCGLVPLLDIRWDMEKFALSSRVMLLDACKFSSYF